MKEKDLDELDRRLIGLLTKDGRMPIGKIAKNLQISPPTVRSRIEGLVHSKILRIAGLVNSFMIKGLTTAIIGICLEMHQQLDEKIEQISSLGQVHWAVVVTGHYDIIVEVILPDGMVGLYRFLTEELPQLGGIRSSESFMVMKAKRKWILLPQLDKS
ncbi:MAG TPA: Lrp/AsnC family transcriptional regulator [Desulfobacteraceae bacterium]|nr:Lrp/AsnC family transcriptional regulator [Desulfobacteraceae bacterium]